MTSNHVLGLEVVLPDGEVVQLGGESLEQTGPDWLGLFVGSEGVLGIALEVTVRLIPDWRRSARCWPRTRASRPPGRPSRG
jgi:glycolate oxidase